jgi:HK97 family phage portal protein
MLLSQALNIRADGWGPMDDRWYVSHPDLVSAGSVAVTVDTMMRCSTVLAALRFLTNSFGMCPPQVFKKTASGRTDAPEHYLQRLLRNPGESWTALRWQQVNILRAATWGNAYNLILSSRESWAGELRPLDSARVSPHEMPDGTLLYEYHRVDGRIDKLVSGDVLHFRGISLDGLIGAPIYQLMRESVRIALLTEAHLGAFMRKGARLAGLIVPATALGKEQRDELKESVNANLTGTNATGAFGILPFGVDVKQIGSSNRDSQLFELSDAQIGMILRALGVPGVVVGYMGDKTATYASADAFFEKGGIRNTLQPWLTTFEQEIDKALLVEGDRHYTRFNMDVLMRANTKDRYEALYRACGRPWLSGNEVREIEDWNPDGDPSMDKVLMPTNMATGEPEPEPEPPIASPEPPPQNESKDDEPEDDPEDDTEERASVRARQFILDAAARVVRREIAALTRGTNGGGGAAVRFAKDPQAWRSFVEQFYAKHEPHVSEVMRIAPEWAHAYCDGHASELIEKGISVAERWEQEDAPKLAALAMEECHV